MSEEKAKEKCDYWITVAKCSLNDNELEEAIKNSECREEERLGKDSINKHALFVDHNDGRFCYAYWCPHRDQNTYIFYVSDEKIEGLKGSVRFTRCSKGWNDLKDLINDNKCREKQKTDGSILDDRSLFMRSGGQTLCHSPSCPHNAEEISYLSDKVFIYAYEQTPALNLTEKEKKYLKEHDRKFVIDEEWVQDHIFYPEPDIDDNMRRWRGKEPIPIKSSKNIESGDIIVFHEYDEGEDDNGFWTNRFLEVTEFELREMPTFLPAGYVIKHPDNVEE